MPPNENTLPYIFTEITKTAYDSIPPDKDKIKLVIFPNIIKFKTGLKTTMHNAENLPHKKRAAITAIFANPSFNPGTGIKAETGMKDSIKEREKERERSNAVKVIFPVFMQLPS